MKIQKLPTDNFYPFGLKGRYDYICPMQKAHRHLEVEFFSIDAADFVRRFGQKTFKYTQDECAFFWGCFEHQLLEVTRPSRGFITYIPLDYFLSMQLPAYFVQNLLSGKCFRLKKTAEVIEIIEMLKRWMPAVSVNPSTLSKPVDLLIKGSLHLLVDQVLKQSFQHEECSKTSNEVSGIQGVVRMISFMAQNYQEPLNIKDICSEIKLNHTYARNLFSKVIGMTPYDFLLKYRLDSAKYLLQHTDRSVLDVAMNCGFGSLSQFYLSFKKVTETSPKQYRMLFREGQS